MSSRVKRRIITIPKANNNSMQVQVDEPVQEEQTVVQEEQIVVPVQIKELEEELNEDSSKSFKDSLKEIFDESDDFTIESEVKQTPTPVLPSTIKISENKPDVTEFNRDLKNMISIRNSDDNPQYFTSEPEEDKNEDVVYPSTNKNKNNRVVENRNKGPVTRQNSKIYLK